MATKSDSVLQMKVALVGVRPPIWRRFLVPEDFTLEELHFVIQIVMGWENAHLYAFHLGGYRYTLVMEDFDLMEDERDARDYRIREFALRPKQKFLYVYDFGDYWEHQLTVEKRLPLEEGKQYPVCLTGKRACPPEDCGGIWGYANILEALKHPDDPQYQELFEWLGDDFDPEYFDLDEVNEELKRFFHGK